MSTDDLSNTESLVSGFGIDFPLLYTSGDSSVPDAYDAFDLHGDGLASAAVFVIDDAGEVRWQEVGEVYSNVVPASRIVSQLEGI